MSAPETDDAAVPRKKHRHDLGQEDHGPKLAAGTTKAIQALLGLWIALTLVLVVYAMVDGARTRPTPASTSPASTSPASTSPASTTPASTTK